MSNDLIGKKHRIMHITLNNKFGGLEQVFLNYNEIFNNYNLDFFSIVSARSDLSKIIKDKVYKINNYSKYDIFTYYNMKKIINLYQPTCIISHGNRANFILKNLKINVPLISVMHGYNFDYIKNFDYIFSVNKEIQKILSQKYKFDLYKIFLIPNAIKLENKKYLAPKKFHIPVIGMLTRLTKEKNINIFIKALAKLKEKKINFYAKIGGSGPEYDNIKSLIKELKLEDQIELTGWVYDTETFYQNIDIFCLTSMHESFGLVILEAFKAIKPVIASNSSGPTEIIEDGVNGLIFESNNSTALAKQIEKMIFSPKLIADLTKNAFEKLKQYDIDKVGRDIINILNTLN